MENKFNIDSSEIKRILSLHENATQKQYLNVLNEQETGSYTTKMDVKLSDGYVIPKGTVFKITKPGVVSAKVPGTYKGRKSYHENTVNVSFYCTQGKYFFDKDVSRTGKYDNADLSKNLVSNLCNKKPQNNTAITSKTVGAKLLQNNVAAIKQYILKNENPSGKNAVVQSKVQFFQTDKPNILKTNLVNAGEIGSKQISYDCVTGKFIIGGSLYNNEEFEEGQLKLFCKSIKTPSQDKKKLTPQGYIQPKGGTPIVIPTDIDLSQITKDLPPELQTVLTPPTVDGQPNTQGQPDFNQLLSQLQGLQ